MAKDKKKAGFGTYLTEEGRGVYAFIKAHCETNGTWHEEFRLEAEMLANSFALYQDAAMMCNRPGGAYQEVGDNGYLQVSVHYTIAKNEYEKILKHGPKFGLNPTDFKKVFGESSTKVKAGDEDEFETGPMKIAK
jgi:hypothetical protein